MQAKTTFLIRVFREQFGFSVNSAILNVCTVVACTIVIQDKNVCTVVIRFRELDEDDAVFNQFQGLLMDVFREREKERSNKRSETKGCIYE